MLPLFLTIFRAIHFRVREEFLGQPFSRKKGKDLSWQCLVYSSMLDRGKRPFGPRRHIDLVFYPGQLTLVSHSACNLWPLSVESPPTLPAFISPQRPSNPYTGELIYFLPPDTAGLAYSFTRVRFRQNGREKRGNGNRQLEAAEKGQLWLKPLPFHLRADFGNISKRNQPHLFSLNLASGHLWPWK